MDLEIPPVNT